MAGIDAKTLQSAVQLTTNNVSDSQVLGDLLDQIQLTLYRWSLSKQQ